MCAGVYALHIALQKGGQRDASLLAVGQCDQQLCVVLLHIMSLNSMCTILAGASFWFSLSVSEKYIASALRGPIKPTPVSLCCHTDITCLSKQGQA